ncbi:MAG: hypothetical protein OEU86_08305 [Gammaproteobacteria bacterium]|nr:hypothetical protein [Gammaproteobacteria bacterium]
MSDNSPDRDDVEDLELDLPEQLAQQPWSRKAQAIASVVWPSFLTACVSSMLFFGLVDPVFLGDAMTPVIEMNRMTAYGVLFFFFWFIAAISSGTSVYLRRTRNKNARQGRQQGR